MPKDFRFGPLVRRQLLKSTIAAVAAAVLLLGLPLAVAVRIVLQREALEALQELAEAVVAPIDQRNLTALEQILFLDEVARLRPGLRLILFDPRTGLQADTGAPPQVPPEFDADTRGATGGQARRSIDGGVLVVSVPVRTGGVLWVVNDDDALISSIKQSWVAIGGLAFFALFTAAMMARIQGERLAAPLESLAEAARRLGDGDFSARVPHSGLPEADDVAKALHETAAQLGAMLDRSRSFGADASHQLRTPLTALRLDLEALDGTGADPELVGAAIREADRLEATIAELLSLADAPGGVTDGSFDVAELASARLDAWQSLARSAGRKVVLDASPVPPVRARPGAIGQSLQVLLDNALEHGAGTITVSVQAVAAGGGLGLTGEGRDTKWVRLCVTDEGPGIPPERREGLLSGRADTVTGRGLVLARQLVEAEGGRLTLERAAPGAVLCLLVPVA
ncbi:MAG: ATP-binding protein [Egibacteraceae bacterium]